MRSYIFACLLLPIQILAQGQDNVKPFPTKQQVAWQNMEFYLFAHFGPNTFTDKEWGEGTEAEDVFNPKQLDCRQWCRVAKAAGATGIIITAKHHDGFCLWPSKFSNHTVRESKWKNGKGDVLKELSQACKEYGLKFGVYISPWDRNHPKYGTPAYNDVFVNMMTEIFSNYGPIWELWWDGANGEGPNGKKQVYDWERFKKTVRKLSPNTIIFSDIGPDARWCGNENGIAGETNWNTLDTAGFTPGKAAPPLDTLNQGNMYGSNWIPAECDVSIRPGWFYHPEQNGKVKPPEELFNLYLRSVGRGANLLLNVPPDRDGLINENDSAALIGFRKLRDQLYAHNLIKEGTITYKSHGNVHTISLGDHNKSILALRDDYSSPISVSFTSAKKINCIVLDEALEFGQRVKSAEVSLLNDGKVVKELKITTIGRKRMLTFAPVDANEIQIKILDAKATPLIRNISAYYIEINP